MLGPSGHEVEDVMLQGISIVGEVRGGHLLRAPHVRGNVVRMKGEAPILGRRNVQRGMNDSITCGSRETAVRRDFIYQIHG